jgi:hypothetical protein
MPDRFERFSALAGVGAVVLWVVGVALTGGDHVGLPGGVPEEGADETLAYFRENEGAVMGGSWIFMLGSLFFLWFAGILRSRLVRAEGGAGTFGSIAFAGAVATGILTLAMPTGGLVTVLGIDHVSAQTAHALNAVESMFFIAAELAAIVLLVATAVVTVRAQAFPRWWAWASILLAVWLVVGPIGGLGLLIGVPIWTLVTSAMLFGTQAPNAPRRA